MGLFDFLARRNSRQEKQPVLDIKQGTVEIAVGASDEVPERHQSFTNSNITFAGNLTGYDYDRILRDKQNNIVSQYQLADYYCDSDAIIHGIIKHVYAPYTVSSPWVLSGATEKTNKIYNMYYDEIRLRERIDSIALEYWKYANVFVYILNGVPITLPPHKCRIGNVALNGDPLVDFDCQSILNEWKAKSYDVKENWIKDNELEEYFKGYPEEVRKALNENRQWAQLNPKYTKVLQAPKESWMRYAIPFIAACLTPLAKKELISGWEKAMLNLGIHSFVHARYGDKNKGADILPDRVQLKAVQNVFSKAMNGFPLAVTNQLAEAYVVQPDMDDLFQFDKYRDVDNDILSAGGISGILVNGISADGSTFASAQVSMQTAAARIEAARDEIAELMCKINVCIQEELAKRYSYNIKDVPKFSFMPLDMAGRKALREDCVSLWEKGLVSTRTMMETQGYSIEKEKMQRQKEASDGTDETLCPREETSAQPSATTEEPESNNKVGRPQMDNDERNSDPANAIRSKQPKPSNPEGSDPEIDVSS